MGFDQVLLKKRAGYAYTATVGYQVNYDITNDLDGVVHDTTHDYFLKWYKEDTKVNSPKAALCV